MLNLVCPTVVRLTQGNIRTAANLLCPAVLAKVNYANKSSPRFSTGGSGGEIAFVLCFGGGGGGGHVSTV